MAFLWARGALFVQWARGTLVILRRKQEGAFVRVDYGPIMSKTLVNLNASGDKRVKIIPWDVREIVCCCSIVQAYSSYEIGLTKNF
jgi:hypothetical protein